MLKRKPVDWKLSKRKLYCVFFVLEASRQKSSLSATTRSRPFRVVPVRGLRKDKGCVTCISAWLRCASARASPYRAQPSYSTFFQLLLMSCSFFLICSFFAPFIEDSALKLHRENAAPILEGRKNSMCVGSYRFKDPKWLASTTRSREKARIRPARAIARARVEVTVEREASVCASKRGARGVIDWGTCATCAARAWCAVASASASASRRAARSLESSP